ncbi:MAG TPA: pantoate--beta-alanine ligase, partial [Miltoncostaeaceae bacterium]|nr:pantoate--beta-alanine ligase [Miltoncostaeaceae bacterium]
MSAGYRRGRPERHPTRSPGWRYDPGAAHAQPGIPRRGSWSRGVGRGRPQSRRALVRTARGGSRMSAIPAESPPTPTVPVVRTVGGLRRAVAALRAEGRRIAVVPTMGAFHDGHLDLMDRAGADGYAVVVTLFVNPTQFAAGEDLSTYPRREARDVALAAGRGVALVFAPGPEEMYPEGHATSITVSGPSAG